MSRTNQAGAHIDDMRVRITPDDELMIPPPPPLPRGRWRQALRSLRALLADPDQTSNAVEFAYAVGQRQHEIGIRMALGARSGQVQAMILRQGLVFALVGVLVLALRA